MKNSKGVNNNSNNFNLTIGASVQKNEMHKVSLDFEILRDHILPARRTDLVIVKKEKKQKRTCQTVNVAVPADHRVKIKEIKKRDKYWDIARELARSFINCNWCTWYNSQWIDKETRSLRNQRTSWDNLDNSIGQNTKKSPGDLRRLTVSQHPV